MKAKPKSSFDSASRPPLPAKPAPSHEAIAACAKELWEKRGRPEGHDLEFWFEAERILREHANSSASEDAVIDTVADEALRSASEPRPRNSRDL